MIIVAGLDIGSLSTKAVLLDQEERVLSEAVLLTAGESRKSAEKAFTEALAKADLSRDNIDYVVTTGYGRDRVPYANKEITEITAHATGAHFIHSEARTILDIGGQDSKAISLDYNGQIVDFAMNDKCAAGTGRFIEVMAQALGVNLDEMSVLSDRSITPTAISSFCTVFAESEVVSQVAEGQEKADIIRGIHEAIAERASTLLNRVKTIEPLAMTGGVAKNKGVVHALENKLKLKLSIAKEPQTVGALGAALVGLKALRRKKTDFVNITESL